MVFISLFAPQGPLNELLRSVGFGTLARGWLADVKTVMPAIIAVEIWRGSGSTMIIFLAGLKQIPSEHYEAASIDGAGRIQQFFNITIPSLTPVILFNLVMQMISAFQAFTPAYIISGGRGGPIDSTLFYTLHLYNQGWPYREMGYASAMAWVLLVIIAFFTALIFRTSGTWVNYGSGE
jgi:multiple sugar transport system permease protein